VNKLTPVALPPGRLMLATSPSWIEAASEHDGYCLSRRFRRLGRGSVGGDEHRHLPTNELGREQRQKIVLPFRETVLDRNVAPNREARCLESL
jgi:hypothetical protein